MKIRFLLLGMSLSLIPNLTFDTETSCNGGKGVKCPFGNKWACLTSEEECLNLAFDKLGFSYTCTGTGEQGIGNACNGKYQGCTCDSSYQYTCSGTGYSGGVGTACGGKYAACTCASGYEWKDGSCQKQIINGAQGDLYYCNGTVVGVKAGDMDFYVAMKDLGRMNWSSANSQCRNYSFCGNVKGTLPTRDQLVTLYNNKSRVNSLLSTNGGTKLQNSYYWSSTSGDYNGYYIVDMSNGLYRNYGSSNDAYVRSVLTSWYLSMGRVRTQFVLCPNLATADRCPRRLSAQTAPVYSTASVVASRCNLRGDSYN